MATYGSNPDVEFAAVQAWFMHKKGMDEDEAYIQARFRMRDLIAQKKRVWECYRRFKFMDQAERNKESVSVIDSWINNVKEGIKENAVREMEKKQMVDQFKQSVDGLRAPTTIKRRDNEDPQEIAMENELGGVRKEEWEFDRKWEENIKLMRFIEYTDYIAKNPHLGLADPTEILLGIPNNQNKKKLLTKMATRDRRKMRYISK